MEVKPYEQKQATNPQCGKFTGGGKEKADDRKTARPVSHVRAPREQMQGLVHEGTTKRKRRQKSMIDERMYNGYAPDPAPREELAPTPTTPTEAEGGGTPRSYPTCRFCGRQQLPLATYPDKETADEAATMRCDCYDARAYQKEVERREEREKNIARLRIRLDDLAEYCEGRGVPLEGETLDILMRLGTYVLDGLIGAATVKWTRLRVNITTNGKGAIVIGFNYTDAAKIEV